MRPLTQPHRHWPFCTTFIFSTSEILHEHPALTLKFAFLCISNQADVELQYALPLTEDAPTPPPSTHPHTHARVPTRSLKSVCTCPSIFSSSPSLLSLDHHSKSSPRHHVVSPRLTKYIKSCVFFFYWLWAYAKHFFCAGLNFPT